MLAGGRPLLDTRTDAALFIDRKPEVDALRDGLRRGFNCLVHGERGSGKTSLLRRVMYLEGKSQLGDKDFVFVSGAGLRTPGDLLAAVLSATRSEEPAPARVERPVADLMSELQGWAGRSSRSIPPVVVLDDADPVVANRLIGALRDELWQLEVPWLVSVPSTGLQEVLSPPTDAFFELVVKLPPLSDADAATLLEMRMRQDLPVHLVAELVSAGGGNPRRLLSLGRAVLASGPTAVMDGLRRRESALAELGRPAHMLFVELESLGPSSASDTRLLERMGWTRARATQVLHELEKRGLVTSEMVRVSDGGGRPRKVYSVVSESEFGRLSA